MRGIGMWDSSSISTLFSGFSSSRSSNAASSFIANMDMTTYSGIRSGSYFKLLKSYYGNNLNSKAQSLVSSSVSTSKDSAKTLASIESESEDMVKSAQALYKNSRKDDTIKGLDSTLRETNEYANELYQKLLFLEFLIQLNRITLHGGIEYINTFSSNKKIVEILDFLNKNLTNRISIDELADKFYMSRYHLMHTFKEETGCTIGSYITTKRLLLARDMIRDGSSVSAACDACGFGSYSSFIRAYRKQFHSTPTNT